MQVAGLFSNKDVPQQFGIFRDDKARAHARSHRFREGPQQNAVGQRARTDVGQTYGSTA